MRGRLRSRLLPVLAFVALFAMVPSPDPAHGKPYLGYLMVREWLLGPASPLAEWTAAGPPPVLRATLRTSPPIEDPAELERREQELARLADEWALVHPTAAGATRPQLALMVQIGDVGLRADLARPDGSAARLERALPGRFGLMPALLAIVLAVLTRNVLVALLCAGLAGAMAFVATGTLGAAPSLLEVATGGVAHFFGDALWRRSIGEDFYLRITVFVVFLFMTVGLITRNGGVYGLVERLQRVVRGPVTAQLAAFVSGCAVFFDDYTNCLLVGTTMRPLTDRARVSREKLAYVVDSTAAPIAGLSVFSTWVVYEMSQYRTPLTMVTRPDGTPYTEGDAFGVFLDSLPYRFYSWFALVLVVLVIVLRRDFGPMLTAERRARRGDAALDAAARPMAVVDERLAAPPERTPRRARNALVPLGVLVFGTVGTMLWQGIDAANGLDGTHGPDGAPGLGAWLRLVLANARSDVALLCASIAAWVVAVAMTLSQRLLPLREIARTSLRATRALYVAFGILFLAWTLGHVCRDLGTSLYLTAAVRGAMTAAALPIVLFLVAGLMAFATGTSFGTMAILLPNVVVLAHQLGTDAAFGGSAAAGGTALMLVAIGAVLEGAIFGDHCSPISDTTVLSSLGSQCDLLAHVSTQLPYAAFAMVTAGVCGYLPVVWFGPDVWPFGMAAGIGVLALGLRVFGRDPG